MKGVILVGGKGTRIRPLTYIKPKPMLPLINKPFMEFFINRIRAAGIKEIILSTGYLPDAFNEYFGDGKKFGVKLIYVTEKSPLGTCGAVKNLERYLGKEPFMVFNGDILTEINLRQMISFHKSKKADITISLTPVEDPTSYGLVPLDKDSRVLDFLEKPSMDEISTNLINAGTYIIAPHIMGHVPSGESYSFERDLFPKALKLGYSIYGFVSYAYWLDVGTPEKYKSAHFDILDKKISFDFPYKRIHGNIYIDEGVKYNKNNLTAGPVVIGKDTIIGKDAKVLPHSVIGKNCKISNATIISESIIFDGCNIGKNCIIRNSIIAENVDIGNNVKIEGNSVVGDNTKIEDNNSLNNGIKVNIDSHIKKDQISF